MRTLPTLPRRGPGHSRSQAPTIGSTVVFRDVHLPETNWPSDHAMRPFVKDVQPNDIGINDGLLGGDESLQAFGPSEEGLLLANHVLNEITEDGPHAIRKFIQGNHCYRLTRRLILMAKSMSRSTDAKSRPQLKANSGMKPGDSRPRHQYRGCGRTPISSATWAVLAVHAIRCDPLAV